MTGLTNDLLANDIQFFNHGNESELQNQESYVTEDKTQSDDTGDPFPVVPINDYLPLLAVAAVGLGFYYRKEINKTIKSN